jgi:ABC-type phosphate transport system substrate-binding protein
MSYKKSPSILNLALLVALAASPIAALYWSLESGIAQSPSVALPTNVPAGATVRIDGSSSMAVVNQSLKQRYEKESPGATVDVGSNGSDAALQALLNGEVDIAAIGRPLTAAEKQKGLVPVAIGREKIAIITSSKNPYSGNVTFEQFAKLFRGEIKDWSQLGGAPGKIRFIDRPETSDTRRAFKTYPVFKAAPFQTGATAETVSQDSTAEVIQTLGNDGVGYAVYSQVKSVDGVKIISMHQTLPDDPAYPFSQPRYFVTKGTPAAATQNFLTYATGASGLAAIATANQAEVAANAAGENLSRDLTPTPAVSPSAATLPDATTPDATPSPSPESVAIAPVPDPTNRGLAGLIPWLLLVPAAILGWIWWSAKGRRTPAAPLSGSASDVASGAASDVARSPQLPVGESMTASIAEPVAEVLPAAPTSSPSVTAVPPVVESPTAPLTEPVIGGVNNVSGNISGINPAILGGAAIAGAAGLAGLAGSTSKEQDEPEMSTVIEPTLDQTTSETVSPIVPIAAESVAEAPTPAAPTDLNLGLAAGAALAAGAGTALWATRSQDTDPTNVGIPPSDAVLPITGNSNLASDLATVDDGLAELPAGYGESHIVLMPRDPQWAYAYWDVSESHKAALRHEGGDRLALRFYDVTDTEFSQQNPHSLQQYDCEEIATNWYIPVPLSDRDYIVEIGYLTQDERWLMLARSAPIRIPPIYPSDLIEEQDVTIAWDEELSGKIFSAPLPYQKKVRTMHEAMYELAHGVESDRAAGSLYGSMQTNSAHISPSGIGMSGIGMSGIGMSGVGMSGVGMSGIGMSGIGMSGVGMQGWTTSGIGMSGIGMSGVGMMSGAGMQGWTTSGIGMSGIGMSGIGLFASMPPIRSRKFWLVADAELIIYGATEPDAALTIAGRPVQLNSDGTFRFQMSFQDGSLDFPILAVASDGVQTRTIHLTFDRATPVRNTNQKDEAVEEWFPNQ